MAHTYDGNRGSSQAHSAEAPPTRVPASTSDPSSEDAPRIRDRASGPDGHDPADSRDARAVRAFIEGFTGLLTQAGFPRTPARIFVALLTSDSSRLTAAELGEILKTSPASVSGGVRYLIQVGLVTAEGEPGSRRQHYRMPTDVWEEIVGLRDRQFARWVTELRDGVTALGPDTPAGARMAVTVRYFEFLSAEMSNLLSRWRERGP